MRHTENPKVQMHEMTGLGRPIDPKLRSNRVAVAGSVLAGTIYILSMWLGQEVPDFVGAVSVAMGVFLSWALVREIDPDNNGAAYLAMAGAGIVGILSPPAALVAGVLLLTTRILSGSVGSGLRSPDLLVLVAAAAYAGTQPVAWPIAGLLVFAVIRSPHPMAKAAATSMTVAALGSALIFVSDFTPAVPGLGTWIVLLGLAVTGWRQIRFPHVESLSDAGTPISPTGVGLARLATLTAIVAGSLCMPETGLTDLGPAVAAFAVVALWPQRTPVPENATDEPVALSGASIPPAF